MWLPTAWAAEKLGKDAGWPSACVETRQRLLQRVAVDTLTMRKSVPKVACHAEPVVTAGRWRRRCRRAQRRSLPMSVLLAKRLEIHDEVVVLTELCLADQLDDASHRFILS